MVKKEIEVCDICKKVVAETKCEFCNADLCHSCRIPFGIGTEDKLMFHIVSCSNCYEILQSIELKKEFKDCSNIRRELIDVFKRLIQLEELEGKVKKKKPKEIYPGLFNRFYPKSGIGTAVYSPKNPNFAWAASKAGKISRYKLNDDDDKA
jgi:hypothetical protein